MQVHGVDPHVGWIYTMKPEIDPLECQILAHLTYFRVLDERRKRFPDSGFNFWGPIRLRPCFNKRNTKRFVGRISDADAANLASASLGISVDFNINGKHIMFVALLYEVEDGGF